MKTLVWRVVAAVGAVLWIVGSWLPDPQPMFGLETDHARLVAGTPLQSFVNDVGDGVCVPGRDGFRCEWTIRWTVDPRVDGDHILSMWTGAPESAMLGCPTDCHWAYQQSVNPARSPLTRTDRVAVDVPEPRRTIGLVAFVAAPGQQFTAAWTGVLTVTADPP